VLLFSYSICAAFLRFSLSVFKVSACFFDTERGTDIVPSINISNI
jgi:hypothetical protein